MNTTVPYLATDVEAVAYQQVHPKYKIQLRIELTLQWLVYIAACAVVAYFANSPWSWVAAGLCGLLCVVLLLLLLIWAPRRYQLTGYALNPDEVHYRTGALWRKQVSVPVNRIQHVEISQGVIERGLTLAKLVIYTAGGSGSDLALPGLPLVEAERLRATLLRQVTLLAEHETNLVDEL